MNYSGIIDLLDEFEDICESRLSICFHNKDCCSNSASAYANYSGQQEILQYVVAPNIEMIKAYVYGLNDEYLNKCLNKDTEPTDKELDAIKKESEHGMAEDG